VSAVRQSTESEHSGRLLLRMPRALHGELAQAAEREGVSLNRLIVTRLSRSLAPGAPAQGSDAAAPRVAEPRSRLLRYALAVNFAVLVVTAAAALALLITAYR
jgi:16S rRNA C1402 (ribose-2'-O) methylase RsmI